MKVSKEYQAPGFVAAFMLASFLCVLAGAATIITAVKAEEFPLAAVGFFMAAAVNYLYAQIADAVARSAWQIARLAADLQPVISELAKQANERAARDRAAELEARRVAEEQTQSE